VTGFAFDALMRRSVPGLDLAALTELLDAAVAAGVIGSYTLTDPPGGER
jgi:hypothetical protein